MKHNIKTDELKIGLALGSGAARGLTHIGVIKAIEENQIKLDYIAGSSIGALIGGAYAMGMTIEEIEYIALQTDWKMMAKLFLPSLSLSSLLNDNYLNEILYSLFSIKTFDDLKIPFSAVATNIQTGKMVVLDKGEILPAIRASISIPIIFSPVTIGEHKLVDGGLVNPTPVDIIKNKKMDKIIAVNLKRLGTSEIYQDISNQIPNTLDIIKDYSINEKIQYFIKHPINYINKNSSKKTPDPKYWKMLYQMFIIAQDNIKELKMQITKPDILIEPDAEDFKSFDFSKAKELIEIGYSTAKRELKNIDLYK